MNIFLAIVISTTNWLLPRDPDQASLDEIDQLLVSNLVVLSRPTTSFVKTSESENDLHMVTTKAGCKSVI